MTDSCVRCGNALGLDDFFEDGETRPHIIHNSDEPGERTEGPLCMRDFRIGVGLATAGPEIVSVTMHAVLLDDFRAWLNGRGLELDRLPFADEPDLKAYGVRPGEALMRSVRDGR